MKVQRMKDFAADYSLALVYAALVLFAIVGVGFSASDVPSMRVARSLPAGAVAAHERAQRHQEALRTLLEKTGIPIGSTASNVEVRTRALELIDYAITNQVELSDGSATADQVAEAAKDYVTRYALGVTNSVSTNALLYNVRRPKTRDKK